MREKRTTFREFQDRITPQPTQPLIVYIIERDCCLVGNCVVCRTRHYGRTVRVEQYRTPDKRLADKVAANWAQYRAVVVQSPSAN